MINNRWERKSRGEKPAWLNKTPRSANIGSIPPSSQTTSPTGNEVPKPNRAAANMLTAEKNNQASTRSVNNEQGKQRRRQLTDQYEFPFVPGCTTGQVIPLPLTEETPTVREENKLQVNLW